MPLPADRRPALFRLSPLLPLLLVLPVGAGAEPSATAQPTFDVRAPAVEQDLASRHSVYLNELTDDAATRREYVERLEIARRLEQALEERGLAEDQRLLEGLRNARERLVLEMLIQVALAEKGADIATLAEERYLADPEKYKTRKKVKLAVILIEKHPNAKAAARERMDAIVAELEAHPDEPKRFQELAKKYSEDIRAKNGGVIDKWLIAPTDLDERDPLMQAAFAMETIGEVTDIVETPSSLTIAQLLAVTPERQLPFVAVRDRIADEIRKELYEQTRVEVLQSVTPEVLPEFDDDYLRELIETTYAQRTPPVGKDADEDTATEPESAPEQR